MLVFNVFIDLCMSCVNYGKRVGVFPLFCGTTLLNVGEAVAGDILMDRGPA